MPHLHSQGIFLVLFFLALSTPRGSSFSIHSDNNNHAYRVTSSTLCGPALSSSSSGSNSCTTSNLFRCNTLNSYTSMRSNANDGISPPPSSIRKRLFQIFKSYLTILQSIPQRIFTRPSPQIKQQQEGIPGYKRSAPTPTSIRGNHYGTHNNSTIPTPTQIATILDVQPTQNATAQTWKRAWKIHKRALPVLHLFDSCKPPDSSLNLACLWWKALIGSHHDDGLAFDILPRGTRHVVSRRLRKFYPRLHHANVELRSVFLNLSIDEILSNLHKKTVDSNSSNNRRRKVRLVSFGAGYDLRCIRYLIQNRVDQVVELDLQHVVEAKRVLIGPKRLLKRRPQLKGVLFEEAEKMKLIPADLNDVDGVRNILLKNVLADDGEEEKEGDWFTIFIFEGVMIYLNEGVPSALLNMTSSVLSQQQKQDRGGALCFADRLENVPGGDYGLGVEELERNGWKLDCWMPKPGLARHMGYASILNKQHTKMHDDRNLEL